MTEFELWLTTLGVKTTDKQPPAVKGEIIVMEGLYDLILDLQRRLEELESKKLEPRNPPYLEDLTEEENEK